MWTLGKLAAEAVRSLRYVHLLLLAVVAAVLFSSGFFETKTIEGLDGGYREWLASGGMVFSVEGPNTGLDGERCNRLESLPFVISAGSSSVANSPSEEVSFRRSPDVTYPIVKMTLGAAIIAGLTQRSDSPVSFILGSTAATELGVDTTMQISTLEGMAEVEVLHDTVRRLGYDRSVIHLVPASETKFSVCWVELEPSTYPDGPSILAAHFSEPTQVRQFVRINKTDHVSIKYNNRSSRLVWIPAAAVTTSMWFAWWWIRRREFILYRSLHVGRCGVFILMTFEASIITVSAALIGVIAIAQLSDPHLAGITEGIWTLLMSACAGLSGAACFAALLAQRRIASGAKDL